jgi:hypothetical protein
VHKHRIYITGFLTDDLAVERRILGELAEVLGTRR